MQVDAPQDGSLAQMRRIAQRFASLPLDLADASKRVSTNAADYLGLEDRGRIAPGLRADMVVLDPQLKLQQVWIAGHPVDPN